MENNTVNTNQDAPKGRKQLPAFVILGIIALVAAVALALTNMVTRGPIQERAAAALREAFSTVMPAESYEQLTIPAEYKDVSALYAAKNGDEVIGYCVTASKNGYNNAVAVNLGVGTDGIVTACAIGDTNFAETPGFGARAKDEAFQSQFAGIDAVNGGSFDALSGATITSTAILNATNDALNCVAKVALGKEPAVDPLVTFGTKEEKPAAPAVPLTGDVYKGSAKGFAGDINAELTLDESGAIAQLTFEAANETPGLGQLVTEADFINQFVGKSGPFTLGDGIDALSGATISSQAAVDAVNAALSAPASAGADVLTATKTGFQSDVVVSLTTEGGAIATLSVDASGETPGLGQMAMEADFTNQFVGKSAPVALGDGIDALSGATVTSQAVVDAVNEALAGAGAAQDDPGTVVAQDENATVAVKADGSATVSVNDGFTGDATVTLTAENGKITTGTLGAPVAPTGDAHTASAAGFGGDVTVNVTLDNSTITSMTVETPNETPGFGVKCSEADFTKQFIGKTLPVTLGTDVDAVTGATVTSQAVVDALNTLAGVKCSEADFTKQFIGKTLPVTLGTDVDAVTGATVTSQAVVDALNTLAAPAEEAAAPAEETAAPAGDALTASATASASGFGGDVTVNVTLDNGAITSMTVETPNETPGFGSKCSEEDFTKQFIGKTLPVTLGTDVDAVTGATVTSQAVVDALNTLAAPAEEAAAPAKEEAPEGLPVTLGTDVDAVTGATVTSQAVVDALNTLAAPAEEAAAPAKEEAPEGQLTATKRGFGGDVTVKAVLEDNKVVSLTVETPNETEGFGSKCSEEDFTKQFIGKTLPVTLGTDVDEVSGATITSTVVVDALNSLAQ